MIKYIVVLLSGIGSLSLGAHANGLGPELQVTGFDVPATKERRGNEDHQYIELFRNCAKVCGSCQLECDACSLHCAQQLRDGSTEHARSLHLCLDCADLCNTAARLTARHSPLSALACEACAKGCDVCAASCEKVRADKTMAACAKACRNCAKECREMMSRAKGS